MFVDKGCEDLAFPRTFCGLRRPPNKERPIKVTYGDIVKSELRNSDRRAAMNVENLFLKTKQKKSDENLNRSCTVSTQES